MIQSIERAYQLMLATSARPEGVGVRELARATGLKVPTAQGLLKTLAQCGLLHFDSTRKTYRVGLATLRLAESVPVVQACADFARPWIDSLHEELHEMVAAGVLQDSRLVLACWRRSDRALGLSPLKTLIDYPHLLASGTVLLAWEPESVQRAYARRTDLADLGSNLPATVDEFMDEMARVRDQGFAELRDAAGSGIGALAVPVCDASGAASISLALSAPLTRYTDSLRERALSSLQQVAREMSQQLGVDPGCEGSRR